MEPAPADEALTPCTLNEYWNEKKSCHDKFARRKSLHSCVLYSVLQEQVLAPRKENKEEEKEQVLVSSACVNLISFDYSLTKSVLFFLSSDAVHGAGISFIEFALPIRI